MIESIINNLIPMHYFPVFNSIDEPFSIDFEDVQVNFYLLHAKYN